VVLLFLSLPAFLNDNDRRAFEALQRLEASYQGMLFELAGCLVAVAVLGDLWFRIRFASRHAATTPRI
jgi:hypothetical protein